jgi:hypothetical protein
MIVNLFDLAVPVAAYRDRRGGGVCSLRPRKTRPSAVKGFPPCCWMSRLMCQTTDLPSIARPPFFPLRISAARMSE